MNSASVLLGMDGAQAAFGVLSGKLSSSANKKVKRVYGMITIKENVCRFFPVKDIVQGEQVGGGGGGEHQPQMLGMSLDSGDRG